MDEKNMQKLKSLKESLADNKKWPLMYMFKCIVPNNQQSVDQVKTIMPKHGRTSLKDSSTKKFVSITCVASMKSADSIMKVTDLITAVPGAMVL